MKGFFEATQDEVARLILIRHGRTASNAAGRILGTTDDPLNEAGREQAQALAKRMADFHIDALYSSPLARARETAEAIAQTAHQKVQIDPDLIEYDFGELSDLTLQDLQVKNPALFHEVQAWINMGPIPTMSRPAIAHAEAIKDLKKRIDHFAQGIISRHTGHTVVAVAHAALIRAMLTIWTGGSLESRLPFRSDNASITVVDFYKGVPLLRLFNDICHLDMKLGYGRPVVF